jgi:hypothetical protein
MDTPETMERSSDPGAGRKGPLQAAREPLSLRFLLALCASTVLTAAVAIPMAFQAHLAREQAQEQESRIPPSPRVLGATTVPAEPTVRIPDDGLVVSAGGDTPVRLQGATVSAGEAVAVALPDVQRVDFVLNEGAVVSAREEPWELLTGGESGLPVGEHSVTAVVTFSDGRIEARRADFSVSPD